MVHLCRGILKVLSCGDVKFMTKEFLIDDSHEYDDDEFYPTTNYTNILIELLCCLKIACLLNHFTCTRA